MANEQLCQECGKKFSCETYLEHHRTVAHSSHYVTCWMCQKHFPTKQTASFHIMAHIQSLHSCNICGDQQNSGFLLYVHLVTSHSTAKQLRCTLCAEECSNREILRKHFESAHSSRISRLAEIAELCCTVHSDRSFPQEDLGLDVLLSQVQIRDGDVRFDHNGSVEVTNGAEPMWGGASLARSQQNESKSIENRIKDVSSEHNVSSAITNGAEPMRGGATLALSQRKESNSIENRVDFTGEDTCFASSEMEDSAQIRNKVEPMRGGALFQNSKLHDLVPKAMVQNTTPLVVAQKSHSSETKSIPHKRIPQPLRELNEHYPTQKSNELSEGYSTDSPIEITHEEREDAKWLFLPDYSITLSHEEERTLTLYTCETCGMKSEDENVFIRSHQPPDKQSKNCMICVTVETSQN